MISERSILGSSRILMDLKQNARRFFVNHKRTLTGRIILLVSGIRDYDEPTDAGALGTGKCIFKCPIIPIGRET